MKNISILFSLIFACTLHAFEIDSVKRQQIIREGQTELCNLLEHNSHVTNPMDRKFVVVIDGNEPGFSHVTQKHVDTLSNEILSAAAVDSLNAIIARTYRDYNIEMYVIVLQTFNIVVSAPLPSTISANGLFNEPLYDAQTNLAQLRAQHASITNEIISNTFSARNRDCLVYSRATYTGSLVPEKTGVWDFSKRVRHYASPRTYPKLDDLARYFADRIENNPDVRQAGLEYSLQAAAREFLEAARYTSLRVMILPTLNPLVMGGIFSQFNEVVDYEGLNEEERIHALAVFAGHPMHDNGFGHEEHYAVKIIEYTPENQVRLLLGHLAQVSPLNSNANYVGSKPNQALIVTLIGQVNEPDIGDGENYSRLMRALTTVELKDNDYAQEHLPSNDQQWIDRRIYWDDWHIFTQPPIGTHDYDIALEIDGRVKIDKKVVDRWDEHIQGQSAAIYYTANWDDSYADCSLDPFDLVVFTNRSSLGMLEVAGAAPDQPFLAPAIFLKYADDKAFNSNTITTVAIALDIAGIALGPTAILSAIRASNWALCAFEALQFLGSGANLIANAAASQEFKEAVEIFNVIVGTWGLSRIVVSGTKYTTDFLSAVNANEVKPIPLSTAQQYCTEYDQITSWANVDNATQTEMRRMRELVGNSTQTAATAIANNIYVGDWSKWKILALPKGQRPLPSVYLKLDHMTAHVNSFIQEGGSFIVVKSWIEGGSFNSFPVAKFVMLRSEMNDLIAEYRATGNVQILEDGLGYERGALAGLEDELFVFHVDNTKFNFEVPSGNEIGVNNLWEPGGVTAGGKRETVVYDKVNRTQPILHNKNIQYLQTQFENQKVKNF